MVGPPITTPPLSKERIIDAAMELVDREGPEALSMRRLAATLGTSTMSTYHHLPDKRALLEGIAERVMSELERPGNSVPWDESLRQMSWSFRDLTRRHRSVFQLLLIGNRPEALVRTAESVVARLEAAGFDHHRAVLIFRTFIRYLLGVTMVEGADPAGEDDRVEAFDFAIETLLRGIDPPA